MKKLLLKLWCSMVQILVVLLILLVLVPGMGWCGAVSNPKMTADHKLTCDTYTDPLGTGMHIFWRTQGTTGWDDTRMVTTGNICQPNSYELLLLNLPNGNYELTVTAFGASGESGFGNIVPFVWAIPGNPSNARKIP